MITLNQPAHISINVDRITPEKVEEIHILFQTPKKGEVYAWLFFYKVRRWMEGVEGKEVEKKELQEVANGLHTNYEQSYFTGDKQNILEVVQAEMLVRLQELNPGIEFKVV